MDTHVFDLDDDRELAFSEAGDADGTPVLAFHGTPGSRRQMLLPDADQAARSARVRLIAPDRPGYGLSTFQRGRRLLDWPSDVAALADHLGLDTFAVLGVSGGGPHALVCAAKLTGRVTRAEVVSGVFHLESSSDAEGMMAMNRVLSALARTSERAAWPITAAMARIVQRRPEQALRLMMRQLPPADVAVLQRVERSDAFVNDFRHASPTTARAAAQDMAIFARPWGFDLTDIAVPVDFWQGDADRTVPPSHARRQAGLVKTSTLHEIAGAGHFMVLDHLEEILRAAVA